MLGEQSFSLSTTFSTLPGVGLDKREGGPLPVTVLSDPAPYAARMSARSVPLPTEVASPTPPGRRRATLRSQFTLVIFMLAFLPNVVLTFMAQPSVPTASLVGWMVVVGGLCAR